MRYCVGNITIVMVAKRVEISSW